MDLFQSLARSTWSYRWISWTIPRVGRYTSELAL